MGLFTPREHPAMVKTIKEVLEQLELNVDEYTKVKRPLTPVQSFYAGKSIFLTGCTGFLGICIVEKLLRDCSDLKTLYLLARPSRRDSLETRIKKFFNNPVFNRLKKINPNFQDKIVIIKGDLGEEGLGISAEDRQLLIDNVDIILHNGAVVKFTIPISSTLRCNVLGTKEMLDLAMACKRVQVFAYVSTAYSHNYRKEIKEEFYEPAIDLKGAYDIITADEAAKNGLSDETTKMFLDKWANSYTFSKSIAEDLVRQYGEKANFACIVYRPSMVIIGMQEPMIGYLNNKNGPMALFIGSVTGALHAAFCYKEPLDTVPVDYSVNALLVSSYYAVKQWETDRRPRVFNFGSSTANPITIEKYYRLSKSMLESLGSKYQVWYMSTYLTDNTFYFYLIHIFLHLIPAIFADIVLLAMGKKARAVSIWIAVTKNLHWLIYFMSFGWRIYVTETRKVFDYIGEADQKLFNFDIWRLDWVEFLSKLMTGPRIWFLNEPLDNAEQTKRRCVILRNLHYTVKTLFYLFVGYYLIKLFMQYVF